MFYARWYVLTAFLFFCNRIYLCIFVFSHINLTLENLHKDLEGRGLKMTEYWAQKFKTIRYKHFWREYSQPASTKWNHVMYTGKLKISLQYRGKSQDQGHWNESWLQPWLAGDCWSKYWNMSVKQRQWWYLFLLAIIKIEWDKALSVWQ